MLQLKTVLFTNEWPKIRPVVLKLLNQHHVSKQEWQDLFWTVHNLHSWAEKASTPIREALSKEIGTFIQSAKQKILVHHDSCSLLKAYIAEWQKFYDQSLYLYEPFRAIDAATVSSTGGGCNAAASLATRRSSPLMHNRLSSVRKVPDDNSVVRKLMLESWNELIFNDIKEKLQQAAMQLVLAERNGEAFDTQLVVGVRESYVSLCNDVVDRLAIYRNNFEKAYLEATGQYYKGRAAAFLHDNGIHAYMTFADQKLVEEEQRARRYLDTSPESSSLPLLLETCVNALVVAFEEQVLAEFASLISSHDVERLRLLYRLINRTPSGIRQMLACLEQHIKIQGLADMAANAPTIVSVPEKYVDQLLQMFNKFSALITSAFYDDPRSLTSRDKAFQEVVNDVTVFKLDINSTCAAAESVKNVKSVQKNTWVSTESKCPELLANYCDLLLRKSQLSKKMSSEDIDAKLNDVLLVLKYVQNKDVFMRYHKTHLVRRLISDTSIDQEKEELMVNRLRESGMPADYINKFFRMLQDIELNKDLNKQFKSSLSCAAVAEIVNIKILNAGAWMPRALDKISLTLPRDLEEFIPEVEEFYKRQHNGRCLRWHHQWSHGVLVFSNNMGRFELEVTTFQMAVLMCWNERSDDKLKMSYENIRLVTELADVEMRKTLWSLVATPRLKNQVLLCDCDTRNPKDFTDSTLFWPNDSFVLLKNNKAQTRGKLNLIGRLVQLNPGSAESVPNDSSEHQDILQLRVLRIQEAIVKLMKMRKRLSNNQLQLEVLAMLKSMFLPSRKLIKEQLEWLIDNKFIGRLAEDINCFEYIA